MINGRHITPVIGVISLLLKMYSIRMNTVSAQMNLSGPYSIERVESGVSPFSSLSQSVPESERPFKGGAEVKQDIFQAADWPGNFYGES